MLRSAKNQGVRERKSANAKARNLRPKKVRESASAKTKKARAQLCLKYACTLRKTKLISAFGFCFFLKIKMLQKDKLNLYQATKCSNIENVYS
jgi:hypothetical protein